jgi:ABC-2 type transport system ATP-binding protein
MLEVRNLNKKFGDAHVVRDLNFEVHKGEILGFLGPNGAGKTTTMKMITCFISLTSGEVRVDGLDVRTNDLVTRKKIGYLPESTPLYNDMTIQEYLSFVGEVRGLKGARLASRIDEMSQVCSLGSMKNRQIGKLSKGFRQRVGLAQAMIHDPDLLILDEPTSGLDPNQIVEIRQLIKRVGKEKTVVYCSHILPEVSATCSRILIINNGAIVAQGTPDELTAHSSSGGRYIVKVKADQATAESKFGAIPGVSGTTVGALSGDWLQVNVFSDEKQDIGDRIFKCAVDNGWSLSELKRESATLEDVFTQLTRGQ